MEELERDLEWAGLRPDEGPSSGGNFGPYIQSQRSHLYKEFVDRLIKSEAAYYCFCTEKRLDLLRKDALRNRQVPRYDNRCRSLEKKEIISKLNSGAEKCIRFKLVPSEPFNDLVYGTVQHEVQEVEGDPVIMKTDGWPTYHLANVVDDYLMNISHVIRGVEWLLSTNKHIMIYRALGYEPPTFVHLPLILNTDGTKLSKRQNDIAIHSMRSKGVFPRALLNFVIQAGGGFANNIDPNSSIEQLISEFDLRKLNTNSGKLPNDRLGEFNRLEITRQSKDENEVIALVNEIKSIVTRTFQDRFNFEDLDISDEHVKSILLWSLPRIHYLNDLVSKNMEFLWVRPNLKNIKTDLDPAILNMLESELVLIDFSKEKIQHLLKLFSKENNIVFRDLMGFLRMSLSGLKQGPGVAEMMEILGKASSLKRLKNVKKSLLSTN
ncbi:nondiscriminating glutamyl-tRNA synthetase EARS2, mitochondrial isoform X2 [Halyomorpha halys]|nr:probable glutamate--tRNA ligase, mitochondrial isoform X2 [Halyomorpha halys]XP_014279467.1 probable glutamate--tRNA ligase, mitochondrial isoform X2 [Halyomorpha halys]